jgi:LacI family transcriptional regulator
VIFDYYRGGYLATKHLIEYGHEKIGCVSGPPQFKVSRQRLEGYKKALDEHDLPFDESLVYYGDYDMASGSRSLSYLLGKKATAIFSFNDEMAFGLYQSARQYNVRIPEDLSIIGFDDVPFADVMEVPLSTVQVPIDAMGRTIGEKLIEIIEGPSHSRRVHVEYEPTLLLRGSSRSLK